jgi:hypothetical protein
MPYSGGEPSDGQTQAVLVQLTFLFSNRSTNALCTQITVHLSDMFIMLVHDTGMQVFMTVISKCEDLLACPTCSLVCCTVPHLAVLLLN